MKVVAKLMLLIGLWTVLAVASAMPFGPASTPYRFADLSDAIHAGATEVGATQVNTTQVNTTQADDPSQSFVIRTSGTLDSTTGDVVTRGTVVSGYQAGADVEEKGSMLDAATSHFTGTIDVLMATAQRHAPTARTIGLRVN